MFLPFFLFLKTDIFEQAIKFPSLNCTIQGFSIVTELCKDYHYFIPEYFFITPERSFIPISSHFHSSPSLATDSNSTIFSVSMDLPTVDVLYEWNIQYIAFFVWFFKFSMMFSRFIDDIACTSSSFLFMTVWIEHILFIHSLIGRYLGYFHFLAVYLCIYLEALIQIPVH